MQVLGDQWPIFTYAHCEYNPEDVWKGTFRSAILVTASETQFTFNFQMYNKLLQAYKHVFTSPGSINKISKVSDQGMTSITLASITYIVTQVHIFIRCYVWPKVTVH